MTPDQRNAEDIWLTVKVRGLMTAIGLFVFVGGLLALAFYVLPGFKMDPTLGASFNAEPLRALGIVISVLLASVVLAYAGAIVAASAALRLFSADAVRREFLWFLWLPGLRSANSRLFDRLFTK